MSAIAKIRYSFGRYDRITINGDTYRWVKFAHDRHMFQRVSEDVTEQILEDDGISYTNEEIHTLVRRKVLVEEHAYYSKALTELRMRQDNTDLADIEEEDVRTMFWKQEWCVRFNRARAGFDAYPIRPTLTPDGLGAFIDLIKDDMAAWYFHRFGEHRRAGRIVLVKGPDGTVSKERKPFDYPSASSLRTWLRQYHDADYRLEAFISRYDKCGHRVQLHPEVEKILTRCIKGYAALNRPTRVHIRDDIKVELGKLNAKRPGEPKLGVSMTTIGKRIDRMNPFLVKAGRDGMDTALRAFSPSGQGIRVLNFLDRVEIEDWTVDLFALICKRAEWRHLTKEQRKKIPRVRATITVAIDCATRCIVGLFISETAPSTAGSKGALQTVLMDKDPIAEYYGTKSDWPMQGRPRQVVADGGPVFKEEFERALIQVRAERIMPDMDPRMRPFVEAVNRTLKAFCSYFTGQSFANLVEKGDYDGEAMASLTFEAFQQAFMTFVLDSYHRRAHRGLGGLTPYAMWEELTGGVREVPISDTKRIAVFGFRRRNRRLDAHGVLNMEIAYWSPELSMLMTLMKPGKARVDFFVDPTCVGRVLVVVPKALRAELRDLIVQQEVEVHPLSTEAFLMVPSTEVELRDKSLSEFSRMNPELQDALARTRERDENFRLDAHESLTQAASRAARIAGVRDHLMTQKKWDQLMANLRTKTRAATPIVEPQPEAATDEKAAVDGAGVEESFGRPISRGVATGHRLSAHGQANDPDEQPAPDEVDEKADEGRSADTRQGSDEMTSISPTSTISPRRRRTMTIDQHDGESRVVAGMSQSEYYNLMRARLPKEHKRSSDVISRVNRHYVEVGRDHALSESFSKFVAWVTADQAHGLSGKGDAFYITGESGDR